MILAGRESGRERRGERDYKGNSITAYENALNLKSITVRQADNLLRKIDIFNASAEMAKLKVNLN